MTQRERIGAVAGALLTILALALLYAAAAEAQIRTPADSLLARTEGLALDGHMVAFGFTTQASLATATKIPATRISLVHLKRDTLRDVEWDSLTAIMWRIYRGGTFDTTMERRMRASYLRVFPPVRPLPPPPPAPAPPPAPIPPPPPTYPLHAITYGRMRQRGVVWQYTLVSVAHGFADGAKVIVVNHRATPTFDSLLLFAKRINADTVTLWHDAPLTVPVTTTAYGTGGTISGRP